MTGLTKDGSPVASSSYNLYGSTKASTDTTGNPFAYNGEARDSTGLDYLRARYYDSSAGTFLTEDSYQGEMTDPLSQNRYSYVHNNPVNYTDPSGHFLKRIGSGAKKVYGVVKQAAVNTYQKVEKTVVDAYNSVKSAVNHAVNWVGNKVNQITAQVGKVASWVGQQWQTVYQAAKGVYHSTSSYVQAQYQQLQAQIQARREQTVRNEYAQATGIKGTPKSREGQNLLRNWGSALAKTLKHVCTTAERVKNDIVSFSKKIDWKKVTVTAGAIGVGIALTVATGGFGAPVAMAIGGAASGAIMSGYDAYSSGQRGWTLAGSIAKGAGTGALAGFIGGHFMGAGASVASSVTQNIGNQTVRQVAKIGVESAVETAIDTGIDLATGNQITGQTLAMNFVFNTFTNGAGSVSTKKGAKADVNTGKPNKSRTPVQAVDGNGNKVYGEVLEPGYTHKKPVKDVTPNASTPQKRISGPEPNAPRLEAPSSNTAQINPHNIRFSQNSVNGADAIQSSMAKSGWKGDAIDVVNMPDGQLTTIDNTRVIAARGAGIDVTARVHQHADSLPDEFIDRFTTRAGTPSTWGEAVQLRVGKQKSSFRTGNPYGSYDLERRN